ncbi:hypothetical protein NMG60_11016012 [Bertholletia excelsa]
MSPLRSSARLYLKLKAPQYEISGRVEKLQTFMALSGHGSSENGMETIIRSVQMQIVNALRLGERSKAASLLSDISCKKSLKTNDFIPILEYCARSPDPLFALDTWKVMGEKDVYMDDKCYLSIFRALCKGGYLKEAFNLMNTLEGSHEFSPNLLVYNNLLHGCARMSNITYANECLDLMEHHMAGKNEITYTELLKLAVSQQNISAVHEIWNEYIKVYSPSIIALRKFIWSFTRLRDLEAAYKSLQQMVALVSRGGCFITKTAEGKLFTPRLDIPIPSSSYELCHKGCNRFEDSEYSGYVSHKNLETCVSTGGDDSTSCRGKDEVENAGFSKQNKYPSPFITKILRWSFNDVIHACTKTLNCRLAEQLISQMQNLGVEPSCSTYDGLIRAVVSERGFHKGLEVLKAMSQKNLKPYDSTLATLAVSCSKGLELDLAEVLLHQISRSPCAHPYNAFLEACDILDQPERAIHILAKMKGMQLQPDIRTYELIFSLFGNVNAPYEEGNMLSQVDVAKRINAIEMDMIKHGIQHSHSSVRNLLKALGAEGMVRELIQYLHMAENQFSRGYSCIGTATYNVVLHSLVEAQEVGFDICIIRCFKSACALVSLMVHEGFCPQAVTYTALIKILLKNGDFDEALDLLDQGILEQIQPDVLLFNTILQEACAKGKIDVVELIVERMHQIEVRPDPTTCSLVFSTYVDHDYVSTSMEALQVLSMRMVSEEDSFLEDKREEFEENFIFAEDLEAESRIIQLFKDFKEDLAFALLQLRWCATLGFQISWHPNQSPWARRLTSNYGPRSAA